jgi:hypothetical protein
MAVLKKYREMDWIAIVEVIEDNSTEESVSYLLKVVRTLQEPRRFITPPIGKVFEAFFLKKYMYLSDWRIEDLKDEGRL